MIRSPVLRCGVRREEEIGARLSNEDIYECAQPDRQSPIEHASHAFVWGKEMAPPRGAEPLGNRYRICQEGTQRAQGREEKHPLC